MKIKGIEKKGLLLITLVLFLLVLINMINATAAANTVPVTRAESQVVQNAITANDLKPPECDGLYLTAIVIGSGTINGTNASELILGGGDNNTIKGNGGNDCVLGGGGNDNLQGGKGDDVCIGGLDNDKFKDCETEFQ